MGIASKQIIVIEVPFATIRVVAGIDDWRTGQDYVSIKALHGTMRISANLSTAAEGGHSTLEIQWVQTSSDRNELLPSSMKKNTQVYEKGLFHALHLFRGEMADSMKETCNGDSSYLVALCFGFDGKPARSRLDGSFKRVGLISSRGEGNHRDCLGTLIVPIVGNNECRALLPYLAPLDRLERNHP